jgi:hypothetical protein
MMSRIVTVKESMVAVTEKKSKEKTIISFPGREI